MKLRIFAVPFLVSLLPCLAFAQGACSPGTAVGSGSFNHTINWELTGDLYFNINNGPHNACGALVVTRNGNPEECTPGWVCTDANGNASKGPWTWAGQNGDETGTAHINWPDGTTTYATTNHYWDKTCPTPTITSPNGRPPTSFSGTGDDGNSTIGFWGAGFGSWSLVKLQFKNDTTGLYWNPNTGDYDLPSPPDINGTITSGLGTIGPGTQDSPSYHMTWTAERIPDVHEPGDSYTWTVFLGDQESLCITNNPGSQAPETFSCIGPRSAC
jgi:hypothetical protein